VDERAWELIQRGSLPGFLHLPSAPLAQDPELELDADWPECAVALASTTLVSRAIVAPNRIMSLSPGMIVALQESLVRFTSVRGWGDVAAAEALRGKSIVAVRETVEMVPGPARLTKVMLDGRGDEGADEITIVCGLRPARRAA